MAKKKAKKKAKITTDKEIWISKIPEGSEFVEQDGVYYVKCVVPGGNKRKVWQKPVRRLLPLTLHQQEQDEVAKETIRKKMEG